MGRVRSNGRVEGSAVALRRLAPTLALFVFAAGRAGAQDIPALLDPWSTAPAPTPLLEAVPPFRLAVDAPTRARAETCLASAVYYEAANQPRDGQEAVAQVVLNRVRHPRYPKSVCGVVYQGASAPGCQFTFACDGSLQRAPDARGWREAEAVAERALDGFVAASVGASTHYHTLQVHPAWSVAMTPTRRIGAHQFYRLPGGLADLTAVYAGLEPAVFPTMAAQPLVRRPIGRERRPAGVDPAPRASPFTAWGLQIAVVVPDHNGVQVSQAGAGAVVAASTSGQRRPVVAVATGS